jgi:DNA replication protein DnaC
MEGSCPSCRGTGYEIRTGPGGVSAAAPCACSFRELGERLLRAARIPKRYDHCTFEEFKLNPRYPTLQHAKERARLWVERFPSDDYGLFFIGPPGTGKTHLAVAVAREIALDFNARVLFCEQRDLLKELQQTFDGGTARHESEVLGPVLEAELLVLDDLGAGRTTPWVADVMHDIIAQRYNDKLHTILTSNRLTGDEDEAEVGRDRRMFEGLTLRDRLGDALMSRLYEMCAILRLEGEDFRRHARDARDRL